MSLSSRSSYALASRLHETLISSSGRGQTSRISRPALAYRTKVRFGEKPKVQAGLALHARRACYPGELFRQPKPAGWQPTLPRTTATPGALSFHSVECFLEELQVRR